VEGRGWGGAAARHAPKKHSMCWAHTQGGQCECVGVVVEGAREAQQEGRGRANITETSCFRITESSCFKITETSWFRITEALVQDH